MIDFGRLRGSGEGRAILGPSSAVFGAKMELKGTQERKCAKTIGKQKIFEGPWRFWGRLGAVLRRLGAVL